jgi:hypothetical protein
VATPKVVVDRRRTGIHPEVGELLAQRDDLILQLGRLRCGITLAARDRGPIAS